MKPDLFKIINKTDAQAIKEDWETIFPRQEKTVIQEFILQLQDENRKLRNILYNYFECDEDGVNRELEKMK